MAEIEDFGEKIHGARKDAVKQWMDAMRIPHPDIPATLSAFWPEPNYTRLTAPAGVVSWVRALRDELGPSPSGAYQVAARRRWGEFAQFAREIATHLLFDERSLIERVGVDGLRPGLIAQKVSYLLSGGDMDDSSKQRLLNGLERAHARAMLYERVGHERSLRWVQPRLHLYGSKPYCELRAKTPSEGTRIFIQPIGTGNIHRGWQGAIGQLLEDPNVLRCLRDDKQPTSSGPNEITLGIVQIPGDPNVHLAFRSKGKWIQLGASFSSAAQCKAALKADPGLARSLYLKYEKKTQQLKQVREARRSTNAPREGFPWREQDVSPEMFQEAFGFRGVQFGNYVNGTERQEALNQAYDGLLDLAYALNLEPQALSLSGTLGLAFGARGRGGRDALSAHYEIAERVINLTKAKGAGSLAHEWFHAFDHHLLKAWREMGMSAPGVNFASDAIFALQMAGKESLMLGAVPMSRLMQCQAGWLSAGMRERSVRLDETINRKYWAKPHEMAARAFESAIIARLQEQGIRNDYLVNQIDEEGWAHLLSVRMTPEETAGVYPYPRAPESRQNLASVLGFVDAARKALPAAFHQAFEAPDTEPHPIQGQLFAASRPATPRPA